MRRLGTRWWTWTSLLAALAFSGAAHAKSEYVAYIPNGNVKTCNNCHPGGNTALQNGFGQDAANQVGKNSVDWWPALVDLDSDGDGQTNGEELGDPCGDWLIGLDPPRATAISNPGDAASKSADPDTPPCGGGGAGGTTTTTGTGGATGTTSTTGAGGGPPDMGQGADIPMSTGAGKADPPVYTAGSCSTSSDFAPHGATSLFFLIALTLFARSRRTHTR